MWGFELHTPITYLHFVTYGLGLLWISGFALIWINYLDKPEYITNEKLWAKMAIVAILTINGIIVHYKILPFLKASLGKPLFTGVSQAHMLFLTFIGTVSFMSWVVPLVLGLAKELNYVTPMEMIMAFYVVCIMTMWSLMSAVLIGIRKIQDIVRINEWRYIEQKASWEFKEQDRRVEVRS